MPFWRPSSALDRPVSVTEQRNNNGVDENRNDVTATCPKCRSRYDDGKRHPVTYDGCGHVICRKCSGRDSRRTKCPLCSKTSQGHPDAIRSASVTAVPLSMHHPSSSVSSSSAALNTRHFQSCSPTIDISSEAVVSRRRLPHVPEGRPPRPVSAIVESSATKPQLSASPPSDVTMEGWHGARRSLRSWFRRQDSSQVNESSSTPQGGAQSTVDIVTAGETRSEEVQEKRTSQMETDQNSNPVKKGQPRSRAFAPLAFFTRSSSKRAGQQNETTAETGNNSDVIKAPLFRRSHWRQSLRDDVTSAVTKTRELPSIPHTVVGRASPSMSYFRRRVAAGDVIVPSSARSSIDMLKSSVSGSGVVTADGLSSLLSTGSHDTGYESIRNVEANFHAKGDSICDATLGCEQPAMLDAMHVNDFDGGVAQYEQQPRQSSSDLRRLVQPSHGILPDSGSEHNQPDNIDPGLGIDHLPPPPSPPSPDVAHTDLLTRLSLVLSSESPKAIRSRTHYIRSVSFPGFLPVGDWSTSSSTLSSDMIDTASVGTTVSMDSPTSSTGSARDVSSALMKRKSLARMSARARASSTDHLIPVACPKLHLTQIMFEIPHQEPSSPVFIGRDWMFKEIEEVLSDASTDLKGVLVIGGPGFGKTSLLEQLVNCSSFSDSPNVVMDTSTTESHNGKGRPSASPSNQPRSEFVLNRSTSSESSLKRLADRLVAYHFCQADNNITCTIPEFVHSIAAYLVSSPRLTAYRDLLASRPSLQAALAVRQCIVDPSRAFVDAILRPLAELSQRGKLQVRPDEPLIIAVDAFNEADFHEPDYGGTISSFVGRHIELFPPCVRLVATTRGSGVQPLGETCPALTSFLRCIPLDGRPASIRDVVEYLTYRISTTPVIQVNVEQSKIPGSGNEVVERLTSHISLLSAGCMLYAKLVLDLIERGAVVLKNASYRVLPINLAEVYQIEVNIRFATSNSFERASSVLSVCLASLYPLTGDELKDCLAARYVKLPGSGLGDLVQHTLDLLASLLVRRMDGTYVFFHQTFREWLIHRQEITNNKFICDTRFGHSLLAFKLTRLDAPLSADRLIELGHHVLKAHIYKSTGLSKSKISSRDLQAYWLCLCTESLSAALVSHRNLYSPNVKVSRLLLLAGANPNARTDAPGCASGLCVAASEGFLDMASLLIEFGADVNITDENGQSALSYSVIKAHLNIAHLLINHGAQAINVHKPRYTRDDNYYSYTILLSTTKSSSLSSKEHFL